MKKRLLTFLTITIFAISIKGQTVSDTVSIGAGYTNQVWYNLETGAKTSVNGTSWDLGFQINGFSAAILANTAYGAELFIYPNGNTSSWSTLDTMGMSNWEAWHNPSTTWEQGAFNLGIDTSNSLDLGWGKYNFITHHVTGDSLFVWKTANGSIYKIWIQNLASGTYNFLVSDYNGTSVDTVALAKSNFPNKRFGYYSISSGNTVDLEPVDTTWHLVFSKYIEDLGIPYSVSGIRTNSGLQAVQVYPVNNVATYNDASSQNYSSEINIIGHDWKSYNFGTFSYDIVDSTVYFVKVDSANYWKLVMTDFGGSANGNFMFEKTKINTITGLFENTTQNSGNILVYPNPTTDRNISMVVDLPQNIRTAQLNILNINGQLMRSDQVKLNSSFDVLPIQLESFDAGVYVLQLNHKGGSITKQVILK